VKKEHREFYARWEKQVSEAVEDGYYKNLGRAEQYVTRWLLDAWELVIDLDDAESLIKHLEMTQTMILVVHFFARGVHNHGAKRTKAPIFKTWLPVDDQNGDAATRRFLRAVPKRDIARLIGKSKSAVDDAIDAFRGKPHRKTKERCESHAAFTEKKLAHPLCVDTGIMLDIMTEPQTAFCFMFEDYAYAKRFAKDSQMATAPTYHQQVVHCDEGMWAKGGLDAERGVALAAAADAAANVVTSKAAS
jgi:hypothetical protein